MITFREFLNEGTDNHPFFMHDVLIPHKAKYDIIKADGTLTNPKDLGWGSPNLTASDMPYYIGTIGYRVVGKEVGYELFELNDYDKKEFGSSNVFMVSGERMIHQTRTIVKIKGQKIYFIDNEAYENGEIKFESRGNNIVRIRLKNEKYNKKIADMVS